MSHERGDTAWLDPGRANVRSWLLTLVPSALQVSCLFVFTLAVPTVYPFAISLVALDSFNRILRSSAGVLAFLWRLALLTAALGAYYFQAAAHAYLPVPLAVSYALLCLFSYLCGYAGGLLFGRSSSWGSLLGLLGGIAGALVYSGLSVGGAKNLHPAMGAIADADREAPSIWLSREGYVPAPTFGALGALGMCLLPAVLFRERRRTGTLTGITLLSFVVTGVYINVVMQTRTPFLAVISSCLIGIGMLFASDRVATRAKLVQAMLVIGVGATVALVIILVPGLGVMERFQSQGLETARYEQWERVLLGLFDHWDGGRTIHLSERYAHNLWLDVAWDAGAVPFLLLLAFHLASVPSVIACCRSSADLGPRLAIAGIGCAFFFTAMSEPVNYMPISYFGFSFYYFGTVLGLSQRWKAARSNPG